MGFIVSLVVVAVGAILRYATNVHSATWNIRTIGDILMVVGVVGFALSAIDWAYWEGWGPGGTGRHHRRTTVVHDAAGPPVHGADGYARTTYDPGYARTSYDQGAYNQGAYDQGAGPADQTVPVPPAGSTVEEEEHSVW